MQHSGVEDFPQSLDSGVTPGQALSCPAAGSIHISIVWGGSMQSPFPAEAAAGGLSEGEPAIRWGWRRFAPAPLGRGLSIPRPSRVEIAS